jgi:hypothetical protein
LIAPLIAPLTAPFIAPFIALLTAPLIAPLTAPFIAPFIALLTAPLTAAFTAPFTARRRGRRPQTGQHGADAFDLHAALAAQAHAAPGRARLALDAVAGRPALLQHLRRHRRGAGFGFHARPGA